MGGWGREHEVVGWGGDGGEGVGPSRREGVVDAVGGGGGGRRGGVKDGTGGVDEGEGDEGGDGDAEDGVGDVEGAVGGHWGVVLRLGHLLLLPGGDIDGEGCYGSGTTSF